MCSHSASYKYFIESVNVRNFNSVECAYFDEIKEQKCYYMGVNGLLVGENFDFSTPHGYYYFKTNAVVPYGLGKVPLKSYVYKWYNGGNSPIKSPMQNQRKF